MRAIVVGMAGCCVHFCRVSARTRHARVRSCLRHEYWACFLELDGRYFGLCEKCEARALKSERVCAEIKSSCGIALPLRGCVCESWNARVDEFGELGGRGCAKRVAECLGVREVGLTCSDLYWRVLELKKSDLLCKY